MKFLKNYKLFESYSEPGFDKIFFQRDSDIELKSWISELNNHNNNFDPYIIKDLFIDFFDDDLIRDMEVNKLYKKVESTRTIKGITKPASYIIYIIDVNFKLNNEYSDKFYELRKKYLKERDEIRNILYYHYGHKSLNTKLGDLDEYNLLDGVDLGRDIIFKNNNVGFDLWSKALWL
jgi:hypothetical protein